jgi:hypothetical protein
MSELEPTPELGTNDSGISSTAHIEQDYANLIDELAKHTTKILLAGLPPFEMSGELAATSTRPPRTGTTPRSAHLLPPGTCRSLICVTPCMGTA